MKQEKFCKIFYLAVLFSLFFSFNSWAFFKMDKEYKEYAHLNEQNGRIIQKGEGIAIKKPSQGKDVPLGIALNLILPKGWEVVFKDEKDRNKKVSWATKESWTSALKQIADKNDLSFIIDWDNKLILIDNLQKTNLAGDKEKEIKSWIINEGSLKNQLEKLARLSGYKLVWKIKYDLMLNNRAVFQGNFLNFIEELFEVLNKSGYPFFVEVYKKNKVVLIKEE